MIQLTAEPIDYTAVTESVRDHAAGAVVLFLGTVREFTHGRQTTLLRYDAYPEMALRSMQELADEAQRRFSIVRVAMVHRTGELKLGEISVAIAVSSPHRAQALLAGQWLIDTLKQRVPVWKKEHFANGQEEWQHPGMNISPE